MKTIEGISLSYNVSTLFWDYFQRTVEVWIILFQRVLLKNARRDSLNARELRKNPRKLRKNAQSEIMLFMSEKIIVQDSLNVFPILCLLIR